MLNGGTLNIEVPGQYSDVAMGLLRTLGIDIERFEKEIAPDRDIYSAAGAAQRRLLPQGAVRHRPARRGHAGRVCGRRRGNWPEFLARTPLADAGAAGHCAARRATSSPTTCRG